MSEKLTREQIEDWKSTAFLAAHVMINGEEAVCDFVRLCDLALAALAPAAEPTEEQVERAAKVIADCPTIDAPKLAWPAWCGTARSILGAALASPVQPLGVLHQTPDGRVFKSFPSTDAAQAPSEALELATALESNSATEYDRWRAAHLLRCQYAPPQAPSEAVAWVRVPKDASKAMLAAGLNEMDENDHDYCISGPAGLALVWDAMLDTAPSAGTPEEPRHAD